MKLLVFLLLPCLSLSELVPGFGKCRKFFLNNEPPQFTPPAIIKAIKEICQCVRDNNDPKMYLYATLYHTAWKIPIYSAYVFKGHISVGRCDPWYIEPQLDDPNGEACMAPEENIGNNQAVNNDYKDQDRNKSAYDYTGSSKLGYDKGHLYPVQHTYDPLSMLATSTLTNAAPQNATFNQGAWRIHEQNVTKVLKSCDKAYVVTGVVPDHSIKLKNRVTVSKYYWRATCCLENGTYTGQGYFGPDNNNVVQKLSITDLQTQLTTDYGVNIIIFPGGCY